MIDKGNYKKLSNRKKSLLTKEFCEDFRDTLILKAVERDKKRDIEIDYSNECYEGFYSAVEGTYLFHDALKDVCVKHNVVKAIYDYGSRMPWYDSDCFYADIVRRMVELDVIPYTTEEYETEFRDEDDIECQIVYHYKDKGYSVSTFEFWDKNDKNGLEEIYSDMPNVEIIWSE